MIRRERLKYKWFLGWEEERRCCWLRIEEYIFDDGASKKFSFEE